MRHLLICLFLGLSLSVQAAEIDPVQLLKKSDQNRSFIKLMQLQAKIKPHFPR